MGARNFYFEPPTAAQKVAIGLIERNLGIVFPGTSKEEARTFIGKYKERSMERAARRPKRIVVLVDDEEPYDPYGFDDDYDDDSIWAQH